MRLVNEIFVERLTDALDRAAIQLASNNGRTDHLTHIVDLAVGDDLTLTGFGVDLDLTDVTTIGPSGCASCGTRLHNDALFRLQFGDVAQFNSDIRSLNREACLRIVEVLKGRL